MIGDSLSIFKSKKILDHGISEHRSIVDITLKQTKGKYATIFYEDYLIRRAPIKSFFSHFIFESLFIQLIMIGFMPNFSQYWGQDKPTEKGIRFFGYIFLVLSPPKNTPIFQNMIISLIILFFIMILLYLASNFYYKKYRSINIGLCYAKRYFELIMTTSFYPISNSFCGEYLSYVFFDSNESSDSKKCQITSLFIIIYFVSVIICLFDHLLLKHYDVSFQNILFKVWNPRSLIRLYCLMGLKVFICHILPTTSEPSIIIPTVSFILSFHSFIMESIQINWIKNSQHIKILTALLSNIATSLSTLIDILLSRSNNNKCHPKIVLSISILSSILGYFISSLINKWSINCSLKRLNSPYYPYLSTNTPKHKKKSGIHHNHSNSNMNTHFSKLESKSLEKVNSSFLFKFKRFPSDDSLTSSDEDGDIHKSKSNEPRLLSPIIKNVSKNPFLFDKHSDDPKEHFTSAFKDHNQNRYVNIDNDTDTNTDNNDSINIGDEEAANFDDLGSNEYEYEEEENNDDNVDYKALKCVRYASTVFKDLCVGFMYGHEDVIHMNHIERILEKFPNNNQIYFFLARHQFIFNTGSSVSIEEIMEHLAPRSLFNPIQSQMYLSITRNLEPASINSLSIMETSINSMDSSFIKLIDSIRSVYNLILYELTTSLPKAVLVFQHRYNKMIIKLFSFVQKYPSSPDSKFYVKLFETFFPNATELKELKFWLNCKPNYSVNDISFFPSHVSLMINNPECFICNNQNKKDDKAKNRVLPDFFIDSFQSQSFLHLKNVKGPYMFALKSSFLKIFLLISILFPIASMIYIMMSDNKYLSRSNHIIEGYSYLWRIDLMNNCLYPALFWKNSTNFWDDDDSNHSNIEDENDEELFHLSVGTMNNYMLEKLRIISSLQNDLLRFTRGFSSNLDSHVFNEMEKFFQYRNSSFDNKTIYEIIMFASFIAEDFLTEDSLYLKQNPDIQYGMSVLIDIWDNSTHVNNKLYGKLKEISDFKDLIFTIDGKNSHIITYFLIPQYLLLISSYLFLLYTLKSAISKFDLFFFSLRETSKPAVTKMHNICQRYGQFIGHKQLRNQRKPKIHPYQFSVHFVLPTVIIYLLMLVVIGLFVLMTDCYERQTRDTVDTYEKLTISYHNFTSIIIDIITLQYYNESMNESQVQSIINEIDQINNYYQGLNWFLESDFPFYCTLCSLVEIMMDKNNKTKNTYYSSLFEWLGMSQFYVRNGLFKEGVAKRLIYHFYGDVDYLLTDVFEFTTSRILNTIVVTGNVMLFLLLFFLFLVFLLWVVIRLNTIKADSPFISIINMLGRLPENALSKETCKMLGRHQLEHASSQFYFDPSYYEQVLKTFPHPIIVIDRLMYVDYYNTTARELISIPCDDDSFQKGRYKLFEVMAIDLYSFSEDSIDPTDETSSTTSNNDNNSSNASSSITTQNAASSNNNKANTNSNNCVKNDGKNEMNSGSLSFCDIVEDYLFDESCSVIYKKLWTQKEQHKLFYSLTIQPIDDGGSGDVNGFNYFNQKNDFRHFALIFKDIGEEIKQQKMLTEEVLKQNQIINQILPKEIANQLMLEQSPISMTVPNVAISFCDIVSFTPWCGSQTPEVVVTTLNQMFKIFDQMCAKYDQVTKIKCIGDCYMSAAGIFSSNMINMSNNFENQNNVNGSTTHNYSYNTINLNNSNASLKTNINITRFIKKNKKSSSSKKSRKRTKPIIKQSNSNTEVTLNKENENDDSNNLSSSNNNESNHDNFSSDESVNLPLNEKATSLVLNKNKIPFIPKKVTRLPQYMTMNVNPHQRSHSKPTIRPSLFFNKEGNVANHHEFSDEQKDQMPPICSDNQFSTASNFDNETENDSAFTDDIDENKNSDYINNNDLDNDNDSDNIHHSIAHLTPNEISAAHQMLSFCLDLIDAIGIVNNQLGTQLQVRVGASFGGPISAGVIGMRMPMFDIWGEIVNEANAMEASGKAMSVHIKKNYYEIVKNEKYVFKPNVNDRGEKTVLVTRS